MIQRTIKIATVMVIINYRIITPVTLKIHPGKDNATINVANSNTNIFSAMKLVVSTIKIITFTHKTIDSSDNPPLENCTSVFKAIFKYSEYSRVYITHKNKFAIPLSVIKYDNKNLFSNTFATLVNHNVYLSHRKFESHKEHSIRFFSNINPNVTLRASLKKHIQHELMWIGLNDEGRKTEIHIEKESNGKETDKIIITTFDLYGNEGGDGSGRKKYFRMRMKSVHLKKKLKFS